MVELERKLRQLRFLTANSGQAVFSRPRYPVIHRACGFPFGWGRLAVSAPFKFPRFFITAPSPCPYLTGKTEQMVFTKLHGPHATELSESLGRVGFRRSQSVAYRPNCAGCQACVSVRVVVNAFKPSATQRRLLRRHGDLEINACTAWATEEQFALLQRYLAVRHPNGGMRDMGEMEFADMVEQTPVDTCIVEYREPRVDDKPGRLIGACLTDRQSDSLSMIYSFFDPDHPQRDGLGNFIILDHIAHAARAGLPYVYLGYWVEGSPRMQYKVRYRPLERLTPKGWVPFQPVA